MEQIYTIPVNEAFEASAADHALGCPFCALFKKLENNELDLIMGASMMEPDVRIKTNEQGFCLTHFQKMLARGNRLSMALTLESHLDHIYKKITSGSISDLTGGPGSAAMKHLRELEGDCYVCGRIEYNFSRMIETAALLWENDPDFKIKTSSQPYFCLPHYQRFVAAAKERMNKKQYAAFYKAVSEQEAAYFEKLRGDVSWFCKKFDYRYEEEPWYDSKDAVERAVRFLATNQGDPDTDTNRKK